MTTRRGFITGLISFVAAPAIVRAGSLMPVRGIIQPTSMLSDLIYSDASPPIGPMIFRTGLPVIIWRRLNGAGFC